MRAGSSSGVLLAIARLLILSKMSIVPLIRSPAFRALLVQSTRRFATRPPPGPSISNATTPLPAHNETSRPDLSSLPPPASSSLPSLDFVPSYEEEQPQRTGARSSRDSLSSIERKRRFLGRVSLAVLLLGAGVQTWFLGRDWDEGELRERRLVRYCVLHSPRKSVFIKFAHTEN